MCVVSAIYDYGRSVDPSYWTMPSFDIFKDLVKKGEEFDKAADQPHCEDPEKMAWMKRIETLLLEKLDKIERRLEQLEAAKPAPAIYPPLGGVVFPPAPNPIPGVAQPWAPGVVQPIPMGGQHFVLGGAGGYVHPTTTPKEQGYVRSPITAADADYGGFAQVSDCVAHYIDGRPVFDQTGLLHGEPLSQSSLGYATGGVVGPSQGPPILQSSSGCCVPPVGIDQALLHGGFDHIVVESDTVGDVNKTVIRADRDRGALRPHRSTAEPIIGKQTVEVCLGGTEIDPKTLERIKQFVNQRNAELKDAYDKSLGQSKDASAARSHDPAVDYVPYRDGVVEETDPDRPGAQAIKPPQSQVTKAWADAQLAPSPSKVLSEMVDRLRECNLQAERENQTDGEFPLEELPEEGEPRTLTLAQCAQMLGLDQPNELLRDLPYVEMESGERWTYSPACLPKMNLTDVDCEIAAAEPDDIDWQTKCQSRFANTERFKGAPHIPPADKSLVSRFTPEHEPYTFVAERRPTAPPEGFGAPAPMARSGAGGEMFSSDGSPMGWVGNEWLPVGPPNLVMADFPFAGDQAKPRYRVAAGRADLAGHA